MPDEPYIACALDGEGRPTTLPADLATALMEAVRQLNDDIESGDSGE